MERIYVAVIQEPMSALDGDGTLLEVFHTEQEAQLWVDKHLPDEDDMYDDCRVNWNIFPRNI